VTPPHPQATTYPTGPAPRTVRRDPVPFLIGAIVLVLIVGGLLFYLIRPGPATEPPTAAAEPTASDSESAVDSSTAPPGYETTTTPETPNAVVYPEVTISGHECGRAGEGPYATAASGNIHTTCPFALNVGEEYRRSECNGQPVTLYVYSPSTGDSYYMDCSGDQPVTCVNTTKAVVYLYGGHANCTE
jgi:serine/threonine-protein kinase